jgi:hypothetical protein
LLKCGSGRRRRHFNRYLGEDVDADLAQEYLREIATAETELAKIEN